MKDYKMTQKRNAGKSKVGRWIVGVVFIILGAVAFVFLRGYMIDVRTYSVSSHDPGKVKIVCLADLHGKTYGKEQGRIVKKVQAQEPDLIVYLGDMVERTEPAKSVEALVLLTEHLTKIAPVYYVDGNHELDVRKDALEIYEKMNRALVEAGAVQINDEINRIVLDNETIINLCGITTHYNWEEKDYLLMENLRKQDGIRILLCHYPESVLWYNAFEGGKLDVALCGHTHGGLIRVPFKGGVYAPEWGRWPMYDLGEYPVYSDTKWRDYGGKEGSEYWGTMIVSGGLAGEHGVPRINNPMEISVVKVGK